MTSLIATASPDDPKDRPLTAADLARFADELLAQFRRMGPAPVEPIPFDRLAEELRTLYESGSRARTTWIMLRRELRDIAAMLGPGGTTAGLTLDLVHRMIAARPPGQSPYTTNAMLMRVRVVCNYAVKTRRLDVSPFAIGRLFLRTGEVTRARHHPLKAIGRALGLARGDIERKPAGSPAQWRARRLYAMLAIAAYTGMRKNEILHLRVEDIDIPGRVIRIVPRRGNRLKTRGSAAPIPMVEPLAEVLAGWVPHLELREWNVESPAHGNRWNPDGKHDTGWLVSNAYRSGPWTGGPKGGRPVDRLKRLGERCGIEGLTFISLRHSFATHGESAWGLSPLQIARILRHTSIKTQEHYRHVDIENLRAAVRGVGFGEVPPAVAPPEAPPAVAPPEASPSPAPPAPEASPSPRPRDPRNPARPGVRQSTPKLTPEDVAELRELRARGWSYPRLVARYGVSRSTLHAALHGRTHRDVPMPGEGS